MRKLTANLGKGFTLIELMIVVAIIGILAAIAIPNFIKFQCRSKQSEAKSQLKSIYVAMESYYVEYDAYPGNLADVWAPKGTSRYAYDVTAGLGDTDQTILLVTALAGAGTGIDGDEWTINSNIGLVNSDNQCD